MAGKRRNGKRHSLQPRRAGTSMFQAFGPFGFAQGGPDLKPQVSSLKPEFSSLPLKRVAGNLPRILESPGDGSGADSPDPLPGDSAHYLRRGDVLVQ